MDLTRRIEELISPTVEDLGFEVVRVQLQGSQSPCLQIMVDRLDQSGINVDDCAQVSRAISAVMDVEDPIADTYTLEVSSPGLDRPLVKLEHFSRFAGFEIKLEKRGRSDEQRRFRGRLNGVDGETVLMNVDGAEYAIPYTEIVKAKLVVTDELLAAAKENSNG